MATLLSFPCAARGNTPERGAVRVKEEHSDEAASFTCLCEDPHHRVRRARALMERAASLLAPLGEEEHKVSWILEDCIALLDEASSIGTEVEPPVGRSREASDLYESRASVLPWPSLG